VARKKSRLNNSGGSFSGTLTAGSFCSIFDALEDTEETSLRNGGFAKSFLDMGSGVGMALFYCMQYYAKDNLKAFCGVEKEKIRFVFPSFSHLSSL
jgi:hypothetical protein